MWDKVMLQAGAQFEEDWRQDMWEIVVQMTGLETLKLVTVDADSDGNLKEAAISRLLELRGLVEACQELPFEAPDLLDEIQRCQEWSTAGHI